MVSKSTTPSINGNGKSGALSDQILEWFENYIETNGIEIGDPLPSEDFIVKETGISRTSVREALTRLRALGVVDSRRKRGMRLVRSPGLFDLYRLLGADVIPDHLVGHVGGFRSSLEMGMESEIIRRATDEDIAELREIFEQMVAHASDVDAWVELDLQFHEKLIRITGNKVAIWLSQLFRPFFLHVRAHESSMSLTTQEKHRHIVSALEYRDPIAFNLALREHHYQKLPYENYDTGGYVAPTSSIPDKHDHKLFLNLDAEQPDDTPAAE